MAGTVQLEMVEGDIQNVLRCEHCNKPFDKQSTLKRHGYYCRSRRVGATSRVRSCTSCANSKSRCDNKRPACLRCTDRAVECCYPSNAAKRPRQRNQRSDVAKGAQQSSVPALEAEPPFAGSLHGTSNNASSDGLLDSALLMPDSEFASFDEREFDWGGLDIDINDLLPPHTMDETEYPSPKMSTLVRRSTTPTCPTLQIQQAISATSSIPRSPSQNIRSLVLRRKLKTGTQRIANLILHTLKSYPLTMRRHNALPPFIHPRLISDNIDEKHMEPLSNCISLMQMIGSGWRGSRKLFWKNVRLECERLCEEHLQLSAWELLAAMQALSIYVLMRMDEGETDYNNFDSLLLATVVVVANGLASSDIKCRSNFEGCSNALELDWKHWIFQESRRRLAVVYRVVGMLVYFEPSGMCNLQADLILAPLPAKKTLWEASDENVWKIEKKRVPEADTMYGLAASGKLVKFDTGQSYDGCHEALLHYQSLDTGTIEDTDGHWEEWCSGMDGFGGLVMLAASLIG